jgi:hypothetical protein
MGKNPALTCLVGIPHLAIAAQNMNRREDRFDQDH